MTQLCFANLIGLWLLYRYIRAVVFSCQYCSEKVVRVRAHISGDVRTYTCMINLRCGSRIPHWFRWSRSRRLDGHSNRLWIAYLVVNLQHFHLIPCISISWSHGIHKIFTISIQCHFYYRSLWSLSILCLWSNFWPLLRLKTLGFLSGWYKASCFGVKSWMGKKTEWLVLENHFRSLDVSWI